MAQSKTFWTIEKEKTTLIYFIFISMVVFYFLSVFIIWTILKLFFFLMASLETPHIHLYFFGWDSIYILILAIILALFHWYYTNSSAVDKILKLLKCRPPDKNDRYHYVFQNIVDEISIAAGNVNVKPYVVPTIALNAFALQDISKRNIIGVTEGLISRLNRDEVQAVVAHEMAHIVSNDALLTTIASTLFGLYNELLNGLVNRLNEMGMHNDASHFQKSRQNALAAGIFSIPIFIALLFFSLCSQLLYVFISREREYRADANAIKYTRNPISLASALYKIAIHYRGSGEHLAPIFILSPRTNPLEEREDIFARLFSTHPPLTKRLRIILNQAHANIADITSQIHRHRKEISTSQTPETKFFVKKGNDWIGPWTLLQLQTIEWLCPDTELRIAEKEGSISANSIPALNHFFLTRESPIWKMRRLCGVCREWLIVQEYEGFYIWRCAFCDGLLVEKEKLPRIFVRKEKGYSEDIEHLAHIIRIEQRKRKSRFKLVIDIPIKRKCPRCGQSMTRKFYSYAYLIEIDECAKCNLVWFDKNELEILQYLIEREEYIEK